MMIGAMDMSKKMRVLLAGFILAVIAMICTGRFFAKRDSEAVRRAFVSPNENAQSESAEQKTRAESEENTPRNGQITSEVDPDCDKSVIPNITSDGNSLRPDAGPVHLQCALNEKIASLDSVVFESENLRKQISLPESGAQTFRLPEHSNFSAAGRTDWVPAEVK